MFIRCIISPKKIGMCLTEVKFVKISSFSENINHDRTTFSLADSPFSPFLPPLKWNGGPSWIDITFNVHWGILGAILSTSLIPTLIFNSIFVLKSWLSCFRGTATYKELGQKEVAYCSENGKLNMHFMEMCCSSIMHNVCLYLYRPHTLTCLHS